METELAELKTTLRSLVVSSSVNVDVKTLMRDYKDVVGTYIPLSKFGHTTLLSLLKEKCRDCFLFEGNPYNPILTPIVPASVEHINQFVSRQRVAPKDKFKGKRRSIIEQKPCHYEPRIESIRDPIRDRGGPPTRASDCGGAPAKPCDQGGGAPTRPFNRGGVPSQPSDRGTAPIRPSDQGGGAPTRPYNRGGVPSQPSAPSQPSDRGGAPIRPSDQGGGAPTRPYNRGGVPSQPSAPSQPSDRGGAPIRPSDQGGGASTRPFNRAGVPSQPSAPSQPSDRGGAPIRPSDQGGGVPTRPYNRGGVPSQASDRGGAPIRPCDQPTRPYSRGGSTTSPCDYGGASSSTPSSDSGGGHKQLLLDRLRSELRPLLADRPEGLWCTELVRVYRSRYGHDLPFERLGSSSIISVLRRMPDVVVVQRPEPTGDWRLYDARRPLPPPVPVAPPRRAPLDRTPDPDDALPGIPYEPSVFPEDCMQLTDSIPAASARGLRPGDRFLLRVAEVYSPSHFWVMRSGPEYDALDEIMDEMTKYYSRGPGVDRHLAVGAVRVGHYCSAHFDRDWHRSLIVKVVDADTVKVRHVDYGTVDTVRASALKPLRREWTRLPAQALRAQLAHVRPPARASRWEHSSCVAFLDAVRGRELTGEVVALDPDAEVLVLQLSEGGSGREGPESAVHIDLAGAGHADLLFHHERDEHMSNSHFLPKFEALENGDTLNFAEIHAMLLNDINLDYVDEYVAHVAPPFPMTVAPRPVRPPHMSPPAPLVLSPSECDMYQQLARTDLSVAADYMSRLMNRTAAGERR